MKKIIACSFVCLTLLLTMGCDSNNPITPKAVVSRYFTPKVWPNKNDYLGLFFLNSGKTIGEQLLASPDFKRIKKTLRVKHKTVVKEKTFAVVATEFTDENRQLMVFSYLNKKDNRWKLKVMLGLPQESEIINQYNFMHDVAIKNDSEALASFKTQIMGSDLRFSGDDILRKLALLFISTDSDVKKFFKTNFDKIEEIRKLMEISGKEHVSVSKKEEEERVASKLATLPAFGISKFENGYSLLLISSQVNDLYLIYQTDKNKLLPIDGSIMQMESLGKNWYLCRTMSAYSQAQFKQQNSVTSLKEEPKK